MLAAAQRAGKLHALLPLSPAINIWEGAQRGDLLGTPFDPLCPPEVFCLGGEPEKALDATYLTMARFLPVEESIRAFDRPVLLVHGDADEAVPFACSEWALPLYKNARLARIPGDTHCYDHHLDQVVKAVLAFVQEMEGQRA